MIRIDIADISVLSVLGQPPTGMDDGTWNWPYAGRVAKGA
jgi:hypothetical protein